MRFYTDRKKRVRVIQDRRKKKNYPTRRRRKRNEGWKNPYRQGGISNETWKSLTEYVEKNGPVYGYINHFGRTDFIDRSVENVLTERGFNHSQIAGWFMSPASDAVASVLFTNEKKNLNENDIQFAMKDTPYVVKDDAGRFTSEPTMHEEAKPMYTYTSFIQHRDDENIVEDDDDYSEEPDEDEEDEPDE